MHRLLFAIAFFAPYPAVAADIPKPTPNSPNEPLAKQLSLAKSAEFLDSVAVHWTRDRKCGTCHTNFAYMLARPGVPGGSDEAVKEVRGFFEKRIAGWSNKAPADQPRNPTEVVATAVALAVNDARSTGKLHPLSRAALDRMWTVQKAGGDWDWVKCDWPPFEHDDYYGAVFAAVGVGLAPDGYARSDKATAGLAKLRKYFKATPAPDLHHKAMLLWAAQKLDGLMTAEEQKTAVKELLALQRRDGGWSLPTLGNYKRQDGTPNDKAAPSDGYATGFVVYVLLQSGVSAKDEAVQRGVAWLRANQRESGRWFTRSLNTDYAHYISHAGTAYAALALVAADGEGNKVNHHAVPLPAGLVPEGVKPAAAAGVCFLEGPAADDKGNIYFSDVAGNRILKLDAAGQVSVFRADSGRTNGNAFDTQGRLISCEGAEMGAGGRRRIVRTDMKTGEITVLTDKYEGKRYNSPNDVCVDGKGRIWFTDPRYGPDRSDLEMDAEGVYRIDADGKVTRVLTQPAIQRPNGLAVAPDSKTLYVIDSNYAKPDGNRKVWAFAIKEDGSLGDQRLVYDFGKGRGGDGMRLDVKGNLWVTAGILNPRTPNESGDVPPGVYVISPEGKLLGRLPIPEDVITNCCFGGPDGKTLYVTAGKTLYKFPVNVTGALVYPPPRR